MARKSNAEKLDFLYALSAKLNEVAVISDRKGCGEAGYVIEEVVDMVAAGIGLRPNYKAKADEWRLVNEGLEELMAEYPET